MRRYLSVWIALIFVWCLFATTTSANTSAVNVVIDGKKQVYDQQPIIQNDRTLVPLRGIFETLGAEIEWDPVNRKVTATKGTTEVVVTIGSRQATVNKSIVQLDVAAQIINDRTLVPLRFVSEALGAEVGWDAATRTALITSGDDLDIHFIDVGQGDSTLIVLPNDKTILIDAGTQTAGEKVVSYLKKAGITTIDKLIMTHPHEDHIGGAVEVMSNFNVGKVIDSGAIHTSQTYLKYLEYIDTHNIPFEIAKPGDKINLDSRVDILIVNSGKSGDSLNDASVALHLKYNKFTFLITGDAEAAAERRIIDGYNVRADVLRVGHHGSNTSTNEFFLNVVKPKDSVISVGANNSYGHPHQEVLTRLTNHGVNIYSTAQSGDIVLTSNGTTYKFSSGSTTGVIPGRDVPTQPEPSVYPININTADFELLQEITGVGPAIAQRIIDYRNQRGPFSSIEQIKNVSGIGDVTFERMKSEITVGN